MVISNNGTETFIRLPVTKKTRVESLPQHYNIKTVFDVLILDGERVASQNSIDGIHERAAIETMRTT